MKDDGLDAEGYVRNLGSLSKIPTSLQPAVDQARLKIGEAFQSELHSLYLYGSVASGKAQLGSSDLDLFLVFRESPQAHVQALATQLEAELTQKFLPDLREVGFALASLSEILGGDNQIGWGFFIKHQCVCLTGEDLAVKFPRYKPTRAVAYGLNGDLSLEIEKTKNVLQSGLPEVVNKGMMSISRKMVRTAFCLVIEEANCWTTDLSECVQIFSVYYPERESFVRRVLSFAQGSATDQTEFFFLLNDFGQWLSREIEHKLPFQEK